MINDSFIESCRDLNYLSNDVHYIMITRLERIE